MARAGWTERPGAAVTGGPFAGPRPCHPAGAPDLRAVVRGGGWLLEETAPSDAFTPERLSDEHVLMARTTDEFVESEYIERARERIQELTAQ